jgi:hypothetical protein
VADQKFERLLELVKTKLGASDARLEIGGKTPTSTDIAWHNFAHARLVVVFDAPIPDPELMNRRLATVCAGFQDTVKEVVNQLPIGHFEDPRVQLDAELSALAERAGAARAAVLDLNSDIVWGASRPSDKADSEEVLERWVREIRSEYTSDLRNSRGHVLRLVVCETNECLVKLFGGVYVISLYFDGPLSEPVAVGALLHAAGYIERLVLALPPLEPPPSGGKVLRLGPRFRSL